MFSIVFRKSKGRKVFTLLFTLYKVKKSKDTTPSVGDKIQKKCN